MIHTPQEHRPASNERTEAENALSAAGWTKVTLDRHSSGNNQKFVDMMVWCEVHVGQGRVEIEAGRINNSDRWYSYSWYGYWNFWFQFETDATMFTMRWA